MKIIYNPITKKFSIRRVLLDPENFGDTYLQMLKESDEQCRLISKSKVLSDTSRKIILASNVEIQYFLLHQIRYNANWTRIELGPTNKFTESLKSYCRDVLSEIQKYMKIFKIQDISSFLDDSIKSKRTKVLTKYKVGSVKTYGTRIGETSNRLIWRYYPEYDEVRIISILFHYTNKLDVKYYEGKLDEFRYQKSLIDIYNDLVKSEVNSDKLSTFIENIK